jgi:hypothetical protein
MVDLDLTMERAGYGTCSETADEAKELRVGRFSGE